MKKIFPVFAAIMLVFCSIFSIQVYAVSITENQKTVISHYCSTIKQSLKTLQYFDIDNRVKLGSKYETALSKFIVPFNIRVVKNNLSSSNLTDLQKSFAEQRVIFSTDFTTYSKRLEELIDIDCQNDPTSFYNKLIDTREARENVRQDVYALNNILYKYQKVVSEIRSEHE